jgi:dTDP-glucose 4,6-dehydratase
MKRHALVAGGSGFVGSHLCELLLTRGYEVTVVDCFVTGRRKNLEPMIASQGLRLIEADINEAGKLLPLLAPFKFDEIYNLASPASPIDFKKIPVFILNTAAIGHQNLLKLSLVHKAPILFASSSEVYGDAQVHPQVEDYFGNVNVIGPRGCYDEAKRIGEALSMAYHRTHGANIRIARIFNTYGPRMRPDDGRIIPNFFIQSLQKQALSVYGEGKQTRSFCFVKDLVEGLFALMQSSETRPVNIGNPTERSVLEVAAAINQLTGNTTPVRFLPLPENDPLLRRPDITRAQESLHWTPKIALQDGLNLTHDYFKSELKTGAHIETPTLGA